MIKCSDCGASQPEGTLFCSECGGFLLESTKKTTTVLPFSQFAERPPPPPLAGTELEPSSEVRRLIFVVPASRRRFTLELDKEIRVGRADPKSDVVPELDLTQDNGLEKGVSRFHATIMASSRGIVLMDLGSTNGTVLNSYRLPAEQPYPLQSGDEVRFGDVLVHLFFNNT